MVRPATRYHGCCGRLATATGVPSLSPVKNPPMSTWLVRGLGQLVVAIAGHEVPLIAEVVIEAPNEEVIVCRQIATVALNPIFVDSIAVALRGAVRKLVSFPAGSYLFHICWTIGLMPMPRGSIALSES